MLFYKLFGWYFKIRFSKESLFLIKNNSIYYLFCIKFGKCEQCIGVSAPICRKNKGAEGDFQQGEAVYSRATEGSLLYYSKSNIILLLLQYI